MSFRFLQRTEEAEVFSWNARDYYRYFDGTWKEYEFGGKPLPEIVIKRRVDELEERYQEWKRGLIP